jgi:hypothetical protein
MRAFCRPLRRESGAAHVVAISVRRRSFVPGQTSSTTFHRSQVPQSHDKRNRHTEVTELIALYR